MYLKQELIRENSSEEKHILPQKQFEKWELKSKTQREELLPHHFLLKKWRQAELWKGERLAGAGGAVPAPCLTEPSLGFVLPAGHVSTALTSLSHSYLILLPPGSHGNRARSFGAKASMTAWMEKWGGIWQGSIFLHTKQCCLYSIPPLCFISTGLRTLQAPWAPGRRWCNLWTKPQ